MKIDLLAELNRMARGRKTKSDPRTIAMCAISWVKAGLAQTDIEQLECLYRLEDPRD
jgi:hypothetical protein